jgi:glucose/arabinose dehydrogenase
MPSERSSASAVPGFLQAVGDGAMTQPPLADEGLTAGTGFIENNNYLGRPADVLVLKDGSLLISDDFNGAVYRVIYDAASAGR